MSKFVGFPSIEGFHNVVKLTKNYPHYAGQVNYRGKIKLHGTNAGIRVNTDGTVVAQSRTQDITTQNDNAGFARWVDSTLEYWRNVKVRPNPKAPTMDIVVFGEWCGPGIMKGTAINQIPNKIFAVFCIMIVENDNVLTYVVEPEEINSCLPNLPKDVFVLPWATDRFMIDYTKPLEETAKSLSDFVDSIEPCDPWVKETFGITGIAEGIVYYPIKTSDLELQNNETYSKYMFKAKGEKHKVAHTKQTVQADPEVVTSINDFVTMFVTSQRCEQGMSTITELDMSQIGKFLKWMCEDVMKESVAELEASGLVWKQVQSAVQNAARIWFINQVKNNAIQSTN